MKTLLLTVASFICLNSFSQAPTIQWQKTFGGSNDEFIKKIELTSDGGLIIGGISNSTDGDLNFNHGDYDYWVVKTNSNGTMLWQKTYGGSGTDVLSSIKQTSDGGYIMSGTSSSNDGDVSLNHGMMDYWIMKINSIGNIEWEKSFGGSLSDGANSIEQTSDNGYIIAGYSRSNDGDVTNLHGNSDFWIVKIDNAGNLEWQKTFGGTNNESPTSIKQTSDNGYIVGGVSSSNNGDKTIAYGTTDYWVLKLDSNGIIIWQKTFGGSNEDTCTSLLQTSDNGYIIAGYSRSNDNDVTNSHGNSDFWVVKIDDTGNLEWQKTFGGTDTDMLRDIKQTSDNGYILTGFTASSDGDVTANFGDMDLWFVKIDLNGNLDWQKSIGGQGREQGYCAVTSNDGGYILAGHVSNTNFNYADYLIIKLNPLSVGLKEQTKNESFSVYPNPAKDHITIDLKNSTENTSYEITNAIGQVVLSGKLEQEKSTVNISELSSGVYILQIGDEQKQSYKLIKE